MRDTFAELVERLADDKRLTDAGAIDWAQPVPYFGDLASAHVATVGLNPSDKEFEANGGTPLRGEFRRFHTLESLGLQSWAGAGDDQIRAVEQACDGYFGRNPYSWFDSLSAMISGAGASYYGGARFEACHLDLVPYATKPKWSDLKSASKNYLLRIGAPVLERAIAGSRIRVLALNGRGVVDNFLNMSQCHLETRRMPEWTLPKSQRSGYAFYGVLDRLPRVGRLDRRVLVLGFNHNIQRGVTSEIKDSIRDWFAREADAFLG